MSRSDRRPGDAKDAVRISRVDALVGRRTGIEEEHAGAHDAVRDAGMPEKYRVYAAGFKLRERACAAAWSHIRVEVSTTYLRLTKKLQLRDSKLCQRFRTEACVSRNDARSAGRTQDR